MHYFDRGYQQQKVTSVNESNRQDESARSNREVWSSRGLEDSSEYIQNDSMVSEIREQLNQRCLKREMLIQLIVTSALVLVLLLISPKLMPAQVDNSLLKLSYQNYIHVE